MTSFVDCVPAATAARDEWKRLMNVANGQLSSWKPSSGLTWQEICRISLGKTHPSGTVSSMVASADSVESALRSLHNLDMLDVYPVDLLLDDIFLLRKLLCVCLMHKSPVLFVQDNSDNKPKVEQLV